MGSRFILLVGPLALLFGAAASAQSLPAPVFTNFGPMNCGLRLYAPGQVQHWCFFNAPPSPPVTLCNGLDTVFPSPNGYPPTAVSFSCFGSDTNTNYTYEITWAAYPARPPTTAGWISYQIATNTQTCLMSAPNPCTANTAPGAPPVQPTTLVTGSFPSLISTNLVGTLWFPAAAPGLAMLSTQNFSASVGYPVCMVSSPSPGLATWVKTWTGPRISFLPDNWCAGGAGLGPPPVVQGQCSYEAFQAPQIGANNSGPYCMIMPIDPSIVIGQAHLAIENLSGN